MIWIKNMRETDGKNMKQKQTTLTGGKSVNTYALGRPLESAHNGRPSPWAC